MKAKSKRKAAPQSSQWNAMAPQILKGVAFAIIGGTALASYFIVPLPAAIALTILAVARVLIWRRQERLEALKGSEAVSACSR